MKSLLASALLSLALGASFLTGCGGAGTTCSAGFESCSCTAASECNAGLSCQNNLCVGDGSGTGAASGSGGTGSGGDTTGSGSTSGTGSVAGTGAVSGSGGGGSECLEGDAQGDCYNGNSEVCVDGQWATDPNCTSCLAVSGVSSCEHVFTFVLDSGFVAVEGAVTDAIYGSTGVSATFDLSPGDTGIIQFKFATPISPYSVQLTASSDLGAVDVSLENGAAGCQYSLIGGYLSYDPINGGNGCWQGLQPMGWDEVGGAADPYIPSGPINVLNVRVMGTGTISLVAGSIYFG